jgi:hypothetical protein
VYEELLSASDTVTAASLNKLNASTVTVPVPLPFVSPF